MVHRRVEVEYTSGYAVSVSIYIQPKKCGYKRGTDYLPGWSGTNKKLIPPDFPAFFFFLFHSIVDITGTSFSQHIIKGKSIKKESISKDTAAVHSTILAQLREDE